MRKKICALCDREFDTDVEDDRDQLCPDCMKRYAVNNNSDKQK